LNYGSTAVEAKPHCSVNPAMDFPHLESQTNNK